MVSDFEDVEISSHESTDRALINSIMAVYGINISQVQKLDGATYA